MGYCFLGISLLCGSIKGYCGKRLSGQVEKHKDAVYANLLRMLLCTGIGLGIVFFKEGIFSLQIHYNVLFSTFLSGVSTAVFVVSWLLLVRHGAYMLLDVFSMIGVVIPLIGGKIFFQETIKGTQWVGLLILLCAVCIMCSYNNSIKEKITKMSFLLLVVCGTANGITDFSQKLFIKTAEATSVVVFNFYTYFFAALSLGIYYSMIKKSEGKTKEKTNFDKRYVYICVMSVSLFIASYFKTRAASYLSAAELYPMFNGTALILSTFMARIFFHEKISVKCIVGIVLSFIALIFINVL